MDKYQLTFLKNIIIGVSGDGGLASYEFDANNSLVINQNENYHIAKYNLTIRNMNIISVSYYANGWKKLNLNVDDDEIMIPIDFNNPTTIVKIALQDDGLVNDFEFNIVLKPSDKDAWDIKYAEMVRKERLSNIKAILNQYETFSTLVFKPCCDEYAYTIVKWYATSRMRKGSAGVTIGTSYDPERPMSNTLLEEVKIEEKFYSNMECAFRVGAEVSQYDKDNNQLISIEIGLG